ncbi:hypothetical protein BWP39_02660 [Paraburkholderia acidicola]|uniref:Uncharacterized protein n=1 Tax=Paraburkholderia acidicola TaxID=1912599 RepID=A0A2A4F449_9BURK|nr:hypothetical protein BWP39_02660 [Paraburkholderia acidicola]
MFFARTSVALVLPIPLSTHAHTQRHRPFPSTHIGIMALFAQAPFRRNFCAVCFPRSDRFMRKRAMTFTLPCIPKPNLTRP